MLRMLDLFAGIGGFSYAGEKLVGGYETVAFCEYDEHAQKVLRKHWPDTEIIGDIRELADDADRFRGLVDIITGGYPCQPFSTAGKRRGDQDDRHLWPEMLRVIEAVRPRWIIGENVAGHITMGLDTVLSDLEGAGYSSRCYVLPAVAADAPHRRDRCWVVGYSDSNGKPDVTLNEEMRMARAADVGHAIGSGQRGDDRRRAEQEPAGRCEDVADADSAQRQRGRLSSGVYPQHSNLDGGSDGIRDRAVADASSQRQQRQGPLGHAVNPAQDGEGQATEPFNGGLSKVWQPEPELGRVANGIPGRVHRLKQLGNSIVPQVAARILYSIKLAEAQGHPSTVEVKE